MMAVTTSENKCGQCMKWTVGSISLASININLERVFNAKALLVVYRGLSDQLTNINNASFVTRPLIMYKDLAYTCIQKKMRAIETTYNQMDMAYI